MKRLIRFEVSVESCQTCPYFEFIDEGWASHHYMCNKLNLSSPSIDDRASRNKAFKKINNWFKKLCPEEAINE